MFSLCAFFYVKNFLRNLTSGSSRLPRARYVFVVLTGERERSGRAGFTTTTLLMQRADGRKGAGVDGLAQLAPTQGLWQ